MSDSLTPLSLEAIHAILQDAVDRVAVIRGRADCVSGDSALAIGLGIGHLGTAKALVGRDIEKAGGKR
jgi:hypothetical protein